MDFYFPINKMLSKSLAAMAKQSEEKIHRNNTCIQSLKDTIMISNRHNLLALKSYLLAFTQREAEQDFHNHLIELYLQLIDQHLKKNPIG